MQLLRERPIYPFVGAVSCAGAPVLLVVIIAQWPSLLESGSARLWLFVLFMLVAELLPIKLPRGKQTEELTISTAFSFAILLTSGFAAAVLAQAAVSLVADVARRKPLYKAIFNMAQFSLSLAASGLVMSFLSDMPEEPLTSFAPRDLAALLVAALVFFVINHALTGAALALSQGVPILTYLRRDIAFQAPTHGSILAFGPIIAGAAESSLALVPLFALPLAAVHIAGQQAVRNEYQALHDRLTNLPNRLLLTDRIEQAIAAARRDGALVAVLKVDLDRFKEVNDTLGHQNGDVLLIQLARRLRKLLPESDSVARMSGDEFAILLPSIPDSARAVHVAEEILRSLKAPFVIQGVSVILDASVGIAFYPDDGADPDGLLQRADVAMHSAQRTPARWTTYVAEQDHYSRSRLMLIGDLRSAIEHEELVLHYQPKAELVSGRVPEVEALVRWNHVERGCILPEAFIELAELTGLIRPLTLRVLDAALQQCSAWHKMGIHLTVSVNLSELSLRDWELPDHVGHLLNKWAVPSSSLELEITEGIIMQEPLRAEAVLNRLSAMGLKLAIDDFGMGHSPSSLGYLKRLPVDAIKIDKSFVTHMEDEERDADIVRWTIELGRSLGLQVIAEGVETRAVWDRLRDLGCDAAQGYYLAPPIPATELADWLRLHSPEGLRARASTQQTPGLGRPSQESD